jgi:hypothetical protein
MNTKMARGAIALVTLTLISLASGAVSAGGQESRVDDLRPIMKSKLQHTQFLIDGLAREDFGLILDHANELKRLGEDSLKRISPNLTYVKYAVEFVNITDELARRAKDQDLNGATLSYIRLTINCVECHKFTRDNRILDRR